MKILKNKNNMFALDTDIEKLNDRFDVLFKKVKNSENLTPEQVKRECEVLELKYNFEIEELNNLREVEYRTKQAIIKARNAEQIPWRRCWLRRLFFLPVTNRAQDIIEEEAELEAEAHFAPMERALEARADKIFNAEGKKLSRRKRKRILKLYLKYKQMLDIALREADNIPHAEAFDQPEPTGVTSAQSATEQEQSNVDGRDQSDAGDVQELPEQQEKSEKPKRKRRKRPIESDSNEQNVGQLPGQIGMGELDERGELHDMNAGNSE